VPPKPNYSFEKRQRELEKKKKKAEKANKTGSGGDAAPEYEAPAQPEPGVAEQAAAPGTPPEAS